MSDRGLQRHEAIDEHIKMTRRELNNLWRTEWVQQDAAKHGVVCFYGHHPRSKFHQFSNFYEHEAVEFEFPGCCQREGFPERVNVRFMEAAIMMCKAAYFGDRERFDQILSAKTQRQAKALGRQVTPFDPEDWDSIVLQVADAVAYQKFAKVPGLGQVLLATGQALIAETTSNDKNWGTGVDVGDARSECPDQWLGTNILGYALMRARSKLQNQGLTPPIG